MLRNRKREQRALMWGSPNFKLKNLKGRRGPKTKEHKAEEGKIFRSLV